MVVYVDVKRFLYEFVLFAEEESAAVVLFRWLYNDSFREKMFLLELEGKSLEVEEVAVADEIDKIQKSGRWRKSAKDKTRRR